MGGAQRTNLQSLLAALPSGSWIRYERKQQMGKNIVWSERNQLLASYTRHNAQEGQEDANDDVICRGFPWILNNVSIFESDKHELLLNF